MLRNFTYLLFFSLLLLSVAPAIAQFGEREGIISNIPDERYETSVDLNQDGFQDIIVFRPVENLTSGGHYVKYNDGTGQFTREQLIKNDQTEWTEIIPADLDSDGRLDLAIYQRDKGKVVWLQNEGTDREFSWRFNIITDISEFFDQNQSSFVFADIDGDSDLDFVCGCSNAWYKNDGRGEFLESFVVNESLAPIAHVADINQNGKTNIVTSDGSEIVAYEYQSDNTWSKDILGNLEYNRSRYFASYYRTEVFDMHNDGGLDIVFYGTELFDHGFLIIFEQQPDGYVQNTLFNVDGDGMDFSFIDYDNDSFTDIVAGVKYTSPLESYDYSGNDQIVWFNNQRGAFSKEIIREQQYALDFGQYNQDELADILSWKPQGIDLLLQRETGFNTQRVVAWTSADVSEDLTTSELNNDNRPDFLFFSSNYRNIDRPAFVYSGYSAITVLLSQPSGYSIQTLNSVTSILPEALRFVDMNNDDDQDVVALLYRVYGELFYEWEVVWYENEGDGIFGERQLIGTGTSEDFGDETFEIFDSNGDGFPEVAAFSGVYQNNQGSFEEINSLPKITSVADLNGDGATDVIGEDQWYANDGSGNFTARSEVNGLPLDFDGDGDVDAINNYSRFTDDVDWYENDGSGNFIKKPLSVEANQYVDIDGDGDADAITKDNTGTFWIENTDGKGAFGESQEITDENISILHFYDSDQDGDADLFADLNGIVKYENLSVNEADTELSLALEETEGLQQDTINIPLKIEGGFTDLTNLSFSLAWDTEIATYVEIESTENLTLETSNAENGKVGITWSNSGGASKSDGSTLLSLLLFLTGSEETATNVSFVSDPVAQVATNASAQTVSLITKNTEVTIQVSEAPIDIKLDNNIVKENQPEETLVGKFSTDNDASEDFTYTLVDGEGNDDNSAFSIDGRSLFTKGTLDYETQKVYSIRVQTTDSRGKTFAKAFEIRVEDVDDTNNNPTAILLSPNTINENSEAPTVVGKLSAEDADEDDTHTFKLVEGKGDDDNALFTVDNDYNLLATEVFDFETKQEYSVRVEAKDKQGGTYSQYLSIKINDLDESTNTAPTAITMDKASVEENKSANTEVGTFSTTDADTDDEHTYSLVEGEGSAGNDLFQIVGNQLQTVESLDYEEQKTYSIRVQTDDGKGGLFVNIFIIKVVNLSDNTNQNPTDITLDNNTIDENVPAGTLVGLLTTDDPDNSTFTYRLVSGTGSTHNNSFSIQENELRSATSFDYETLSQLSIRIQSDDGRGGSVSKEFTVLVNNVEDQSNRAPTNIVISNSSIEEDQPAGTSVGVLSTTDPDADDEHQYKLLDRNGQVPFSIEENELLSTTSLNFDTQDRYLVEIQSDDGRGGVYIKTLAISVTPAGTVDVLGVINPIDDQQAATNEAFTLVIPNDVFRGDNLQITVTQADDSSLPEWLTFNIETNTLSGMPPSASDTSLTIKITATNTAGDSVSDEFVLSVERVTSIGEVISKQWNVYPIPAHHIIFIESSVTVIQLQSYRVINVQGKTVLAEQFGQNISEKIRIDISTLTEGMYLLELQSSQKLHQTRILIK